MRYSGGLRLISLVFLALMVWGPEYGWTAVLQAESCNSLLTQSKIGSDTEIYLSLIKALQRAGHLGGSELRRIAVAPRPTIPMVSRSVSSGPYLDQISLLLERGRLDWKLVTHEVSRWLERSHSDHLKEQTESRLKKRILVPVQRFNFREGGDIQVISQAETGQAHLVFTSKEQDHYGPPGKLTKQIFVAELTSELMRDGLDLSKVIRLGVDGRSGLVNAYSGLNSPILLERMMLILGNSHYIWLPFPEARYPTTSSDAWRTWSGLSRSRRENRQERETSKIELKFRPQIYPRGKGPGNWNSFELFAVVGSKDEDGDWGVPEQQWLAFWDRRTQLSHPSRFVLKKPLGSSFVPLNQKLMGDRFEMVGVARDSKVHNRFRVLRVPYLGNRVRHPRGEISEVAELEPDCGHLRFSSDLPVGSAWSTRFGVGRGAAFPALGGIFLYNQFTRKFSCIETPDFVTLSAPQWLRIEGRVQGVVSGYRLSQGNPYRHELRSINFTTGVRRSWEDILPQGVLEFRSGLGELVTPYFFSFDERTYAATLSRVSESLFEIGLYDLDEGEVAFHERIETQALNPSGQLLGFDWKGAPYLTVRIGEEVRIFEVR